MIVSASVDAAVVVSYHAPREGEPVAALEEGALLRRGGSLLLLGVGGCITLDFGSAAVFEVPEPEPPVASISLTRPAETS